MTPSPFSAIAFLGALAIFIYGIRLSRIGLQLLAGDRLRRIVASLTVNRFAALTVGIITTVILQSSTATTEMLVGFAASGAITLPQAMGVILGADIGTTFVVVLLSVRKIADYALLLLVGGVALDFLSHQKRNRTISMVLLGFGFVFFGMRLMIQATSPLMQNSLLAEIFTVLAQNPGYAFFAAVLFTTLVQNSATTLGLLIACTFAGHIGLREAVPIVLGANVGTCGGSLLNSFGEGSAAKRVAIAHLFFKVTGAAVVMIFIDPFASLVGGLSTHVSFLQNNLAPQIALIHVVFNLSLSLLFLPFINLGTKLINLFVPEPYTELERIFGPKYLDPTSLETPALAFANAKREILRMGEIAGEMFLKTLQVFARNDGSLMQALEEEDDKIDRLNREIKFYLAKISQESLSPDQARMQLNLVAIVSDLEEIGDILNKNILELAQKKIEKVREFSPEGWKEIQDFHTKIVENFQLALAAMTADDESIARKVLRHEHHLALLEDQYRQTHIQRLHRGLKEAFETSSIHLDLLSNFHRINSKLAAIVRAAFPGKEL